MKKYFALILLISILLTACSDGTGFLGLGPTETPTPTLTPTPTIVPTPTPTPTVGDLIDDAWAAYGEDDIELTSEIISSVLLSDPENVEALAIDGLCLLVTDHENGISKLEQARSLGFINPELVDALENQYIEQARSNYEEALYGSWNPGDIVAAIENVESYIAKLESLIPGYPRLDFLFFGFYENGDTGILAMENSTPEGYDLFQTGDDYWEEGDIENAIYYYEKSIETDPNFGLAYIYLGDAYYSIGDYYTAIDFYLQGLKVDPLLLQGYSFAAHVYSELYMFQRAREHAVYALALELEYDSPISYLESMYETQNSYLDNSHFQEYGFSFDYMNDVIFEAISNEESQYFSGFSKLIGAEINLYLFEDQRDEQVLDIEGMMAMIESIAGVYHESIADVEYLFEVPGTYTYKEKDIVYQISSSDILSDGNNDTSLFMVSQCGNDMILIIFMFHNATFDESLFLIELTMDSFRCLDN